MKSILISIRPEWTAKILNGEKDIEIRKTAPKCDLPVDVYIYCTKGDYIGCISNKYVGKVVAKFTLRCYARSHETLVEIVKSHRKMAVEGALLSVEQIKEYAKGKDFYFWAIDDLQIFDQPKPLSEFGLKRAPQSWQYVEEEE